MSTTATNYIQGGADFRLRVNGKKTKAALKTALKEDPKSVYLFATSSMGPQFNGPADTLSKGTEFIVVGPDPYRQRDWYATVYWGRNGLACK